MLVCWCWLQKDWVWPPVTSRGSLRGPRPRRGRAGRRDWRGSAAAPRPRRLPRPWLGPGHSRPRSPRPRLRPESCCSWVSVSYNSNYANIISGLTWTLSRRCLTRCLRGRGPQSPGTGSTPRSAPASACWSARTGSCRGGGSGWRPSGEMCVRNINGMWLVSRFIYGLPFSHSYSHSEIHRESSEKSDWMINFMAWWFQR